MPALLTLTLYLAAQPRSNQAKKTMYQLFRVLRLIMFATLTSIIISLVVAATVVLGWYLQGGRIYSIQSGSMSPQLRRGDAVLVLPVAPDKLQLGEVISYHSLIDRRVIITHRLIAKTTDGHLQTQGDSLAEPDPMIEQSAIIGRVAFMMPAAGRVVDLFHHPMKLVATMYLGLSLLLIVELRHFVRQYRCSYRLVGS
jgi:signal peptidase I